MFKKLLLLNLRNDNNRSAGEHREAGNKKNAEKAAIKERKAEKEIRELAKKKIAEINAKENAAKKQMQLDAKRNEEKRVKIHHIKKYWMQNVNSKNTYSFVGYRSFKYLMPISSWGASLQLERVSIVNMTKSR